jgi:hypothetical protein
MQILETSIYKASGFSTYFFHTLIKQRQADKSAHTVTEESKWLV